MISDLDIWRAANLLMREHGGEAEIEAVSRADLLHASLKGSRPGLRSKLKRGDLDGQALWKRIRRAIVELQAPPIAPAH